MKNLILVLCSFLVINTAFGQSKINNAENTSQAESISLASEYFSKIYGNTGSNTFVKAIVLQNHYYVIGKNGDKATVTKIDIMGNLVWTRETNSIATWRDLISNKDGNLILVGHFGTFGTQTRSLIGVINSNTGNFISLRSYDFKVNDRESLKSIYKNPSPLNSNFPYYITGLITNSGNEDDVLLLNIDDNGSINFSKKYSHSDDEFYQGITIDGRTGEMMLYGANFSDGTQGTTVSIDKAGNVLSGRVFNTDLYFYCHLSNSNLISGYNHILGGSSSNHSRARIVKVNGNAVVYNYDIGQLNNISHLYAIPGTQSFIAIGIGNLGGVNKTAVMQFTEIGNSLTLNWTKLYETTETAMAEGFGSFVTSNKFLFLDSRTNHRNNLGNSDGFLTITESNFENCIDTNRTLIITPVTDIFNEISPVASDITVPVSVNETAVNLSYSEADICQLPCTVSFTHTLDKCGEVDFVSQSNLTGNLTYSWTFGTLPQTSSSHANPSHTYFSNGTYNVCLSVNNGGTSCRICKNILVNNADIQKPVINCPSGNINLTNDPGRCFSSYNPRITVSDNCDPDPACNCTMTGATTGNMPKNNIVQFNVGGTTVTCIATDTSGIVSPPCVFIINVFDSELPKIVCPPNVTISCDKQPLPSITGQATATDNCPGVVISYSDNFIGSSCSGIITRTWKATDASGAIVSCTQLIKIEDKIAPLLQCPAHVTINCDHQPLPTFTGMPQAVDNCQSGITPTYTDNMIGTGCNKYIQRTWSANDGCNNISTCVQNIYFRDQVAPVAVCPPNLTINCLPADWMTANFGTATGTDNCGSVTISNFNRTFSGTNCNGEIRSWWRVTDECGIQNECYQTITVLDKVPPTIICPPNMTISCNASTAPANTGTATAIDSCTGNISVRYTDAFTTQGCTQNMIRTWTANDGCGNMATCTQTITLIDNIAPNIMCPANLTLSCGANTSPSQTGTATATDACQSGSSITFIDSISGGDCDKTITRTWTATDSCGNKATCVQVIRLVDKTPPTFICGSNLTPIECIQNAGNIGISNIMDNCGGKTNVTKVDVVSVNGCLTTIIRTWTVTDQCGNSATCAQEIRMQDTKPPVLSGCGRKITVQGVRNSVGLCQATVNITSPTATDMCDSSVVLSNSFNNTSNASGTYPSGQTIITWTAKDDCGLMVMCRDTVVVLACPDCCYNRTAFDSIVSTSISITRNECEIIINKSGLTPCQRLKFIWGDGQTSAYFTGTTITTSHDYGTSGDYLLCAVIEELAADSSVCFKDTICRDVCVTCGDRCVDDRIVYECGNIVGKSNANSERLIKIDLDYHNSIVYAAGSEMNSLGTADACIRKFDLNCNEIGKVVFTGILDDYAGSVKYDKINNRLIVGGIFDSPVLEIPAIGGGFIQLNNSGFHDGFVASLNPVTLEAYWAFKIGDNWRDGVNDIAINSSGDIYVGGGARNRIEFAPLNPFVGSNIQRSVAIGFVAKYDSAGNNLWHKIIEADKNVNIGVMALDVDEFDRVYVGGFLYGIYHTSDSICPPLYPLPPYIATIFDPPAVPVIDVNPESSCPLIFQDWTNYIFKYDGNGSFLNSKEIFPGVNFGREGHQIYDLEYDNDSVYVVGSNLIGSYSADSLLLNWEYKTSLWDSNIKVKDNMIYTIGNTYTNLDQDHTFGGVAIHQNFGGIEFAVGIYALDGTHKKSMLIGGGANERVAGLVTIPNSKDFFVQGLSKSVGFHPNPESSGYVIPNTPTLGDRGLFLGKYSCACEPDTDCCEDVSASFSGQDTCCKSLNLINNAGFDICKVSIKLTTPGWVLNTSTTASGYIFTSIPNGLEITHPSGIIPSGTLNNLAEFCLSGNPGLPQTQQFVVHYFENTTSGNKLVACTDTLTMACDPPPPPDSCLVTNILSVVCDPSNPYVYNVSFTVTNLSSNITATSVLLSGLPTGYNFISCSGGTAESSILVPIFPNVGQGTTSMPLCIQIFSANPILVPTDVCFDMKLEGLNGLYYACCTEAIEQCITLNPCCQPCDDIDVRITSTALGGKDRCCYDLSLTNACSYQYFTKMEVNILTPNVHFGYISPDANWTNCTPPTFQNICMAPNSGTIGSGNFNDVLQFCLSNVTSPSQIPQQIHIKFYTTGANGQDSVACDTTISLACEIPPMTNDSCLIVSNSIAYCDPENNKYNVSMTIMNNSNPSFCAQELVISLLEPGVANPSVIQLSDPLCYGESVTINFMLTTTPFPDINGLMPLIISMKNLNGVGCRGGLAYVDTLILPECPCVSICCPSGNSHDFENLPLGNLPNNQVGWVNNQGNPQVVAGGANGSGKSISLHAGSRGVSPASVSYSTSGVVGPDTIFEANKQYCITFWAKLLPVFNLNGRLGIYADGQLIQTIIIPSTNTSWTQYSFNFISPPPGQEILIFTNESPSPNDAGPGILIDQVCFDEVIQIYNDMTPPELTCPMDLTIQDPDLDCSVPYVIPNISVTDPSGVAFVHCYLDGVLVPIGSTHNLTNILAHAIQFIAEDVCGNRDSCSYTITVQCDTSSCCKDKQDFINQIDASVTSAINNGLCKVTINIDTLPDCDYIEGINWGDGTITTGPFTGGEMLMHTYSGSGTYNITMLAIETNPATGFICFEYLHGINVTLQCQSCICPTNILPFTITHNSIRTDVKCGETINIGCPVTSIFVTGMLKCQNTSPVANCPPNPVSWTLDRPTLPDLSGTSATGNISVMFLANDLREPGLYSITFTTTCPGSTQPCTCIISWIQADCNPTDTCCKDSLAFVNTVNNSVLVGYDSKTCIGSVDISLLDPCIKIDKIDWGYGSSAIGPLATGNIYTHDYTGNSGQKAIIITFSEYDSNGKKCWTFEIEKRIKPECNNQTCKCKSLKVYVTGSKPHGISNLIDCNDTINIKCPNKTNVFVNAQLHCDPLECGPNGITYKIYNDAGILITSGSGTGNSIYNLQLLSGWFDPAGGIYSMVFEGYCGIEKCSCKIFINVPPCPKECLCDSNFTAEVNLGFQFNYLGNCKYTFTPRHLCPKDRVNWSYNGIHIGTTSGIGILNYSMSNIGLNEICMEVTRVDDNGASCTAKYCRPFKYCNISNPPDDLCEEDEIENSDFRNANPGLMNEVGNAESWSLLRGEAYVVQEADSTNHILLVSRDGMLTDLLHDNCCLVKGEESLIKNFSISISKDSSGIISEGTKLQIFAPKDTNVIELSDLKSEIDISGLTRSWKTFEINTFSNPNWESNNLVLRLFNPVESDIFVFIDNPCIETMLVSTEDMLSINFSIYPNPTTGQLTIQFSSSIEQDINLKVLDILGREVNKGYIQKGSSSHNFSIEALAGIYIIQLTDSNGNMSQRKVIKIE